MTLRF
jgi:hypothetical protein